jgi:hypothetical protein
MTAGADFSTLEEFDIKATLQAWKNDLVEKVAVNDLVSRCPIAHKWKAPYRCLVIREALLWRMVDLGTAIDVLTDQEQILGVRILLRCAVEASALMEFLCQKIDDVVTGKLSWFDFENDTMRILVGSKSSLVVDGYEAFNILSVLKRANRTYGALENMHQKLSESVHPNYDGVIYAYSKPVPEAKETHFGNYWTTNFGHQHAPGTAYVFACFFDAYNCRWIDAIESLETWLRENDAELEATRQTLDEIP